MADIFIPDGISVRDTIQLRNGDRLIGNGSRNSIIKYDGDGSAVIADIPKNIEIRGVSIIGNPSAVSGIRLDGAWNSSFTDVNIEGFENGIGFHAMGSENKGFYYNIFNSVKCGGTIRIIDNQYRYLLPNKIGFRFETSDFPKNIRRFNHNVLVMCTSQVNTECGLVANACQVLQFVCCAFEQNRNIPYSNTAKGKGAVFTNCSNVFFDGGYFEGHPDGDIELGPNTAQTMILRARLVGPKKIIGPSVGAVGDFYMVSEIDGPPDNYDNFMQKLAIQRCDIKTLTANWIEANSLRVSGKWSNPFQIGQSCLWTDAQNRLRYKNGKPRSDSDGKLL